MTSHSVQKFPKGLSILAIALLAASAFPAFAAEPADMIGAWKILVHLPDGSVMLADLDVEGDPNAGLTGFAKTGLSQAEIHDIKFEYGKHVLTFMMNLGGQDQEIQIEVEAAGDELQASILVGGGSLEATAEGARKTTDAEASLLARFKEISARNMAEVMDRNGASDSQERARMRRILGDWVLLVHLPDFEQLANFQARWKDNKLWAHVESPLGEDEVEDIKFSKGEYRLTYLMDTGGESMDIQINAKIANGMLLGKIMVGGGSLEIAFEGARAGTLKARELKSIAAAAAAEMGITEEQAAPHGS